MKFKLDENFGRRTLDRFAGHDVETVVQEGLSGATDVTLYQKCREEQRCIVTLDLDFADVTRFPPHLTAGVVVLRLPKSPSLAILTAFVDRFLTALAIEKLDGRLWVVEAHRIRVHAKLDDAE